MNILDSPSSIKNMLQKTHEPSFSRTAKTKTDRGHFLQLAYNYNEKRTFMYALYQG